MAWPLAEELFCGFPNVSLPSAYILYCQYIISNQLFSIFFALFQARCGCEDGLWRPASSFLCSLKTRKINSIRWKIREKFGWWQICRDTNGENSASLVNDIASVWRRYGRHATHSIRQSAWPLPSSRQGYHGKPQTISDHDLTKKTIAVFHPHSILNKKTTTVLHPHSVLNKKTITVFHPYSILNKKTITVFHPYSILNKKTVTVFHPYSILNKKTITVFYPHSIFKKMTITVFPPLFDFKQEENYGFPPSFN